MKHLKTLQELNESLDHKGDHPQLAGLKAMWDLDDNVLNAVLWADSSHKVNDEGAIGRASEYIDFMTSIVETDNPAEAWIDWCLAEGIEDECDNNPYIPQFKTST